MIVTTKGQFINAIQKFNVDSENVVVKPNWVSNEAGEYTEPEILDWLLESFPKQKKIIVESYTPWRGLKFVEKDNHKGEGVTLEGGKKHWEFYKKQDKHFLKITGIGRVIAKHNAKYINFTNEFWAGNCVEVDKIRSIVEVRSNIIKWDELYSYIPKQLFDIRNSSTLISLSKIKVEESIPVIHISMSIKNLFGLIPHPSRWIPFHGENHETVPEVIKDVYTIYTSLFQKSLWITEGVKTLVRNYCEPNQKIINNQHLLFVGKNGKIVDSEACRAIGINPNEVPHLNWG